MEGSGEERNTASVGSEDDTGTSAKGCRDEKMSQG